MLFIMSENALEVVSERLKIKIFVEGMPPDAPRFKYAYPETTQKSL